MADDIRILILQLALELTGNRIKCENLATPELADYDAMSERAKVGGCLNQAPRRVEPGSAFQAQQYLAFRRKDIDCSQVCANSDEILSRVLMSKSDIQISSYILDIKGTNLSGKRLSRKASPGVLTGLKLVSKTRILPS